LTDTAQEAEIDLDQPDGGALIVIAEVEVAPVLA